METKTIQLPNGENVKLNFKAYRRGNTNYEKVIAVFDDGRFMKGVYSFEGRPWQVMPFDNALKDLMYKAGKRGKKLSEFSNAIASLNESEIKKEMQRCNEKFECFKNAFTNASPEVRHIVMKTLGEDGIQTESDVDFAITALTLGTII